MFTKKERAVVRLTLPQAWRLQRLGAAIWPEEKDLSLEEISRRLLLEHLLWAESEHKLAPHW